MSAVAVSAPRRRGRAKNCATAGPAVAQFFRANLRHTKGALIGEPFVLHPSQREDIDVIYEVDAKGRRIWRDVLHGVSRGWGKSPIAAGCGLAELAARAATNPEIYVGAGARDQAKIVGGYARGFANGGPLRDYCRVVASGVVWAKGARAAGVTPGFLRVVSADGDLQHGLFPTAAILDELHVYRTRKQEELYYAFASAMQKVAWSIFWKITTAGWDPFSILGEAYTAMLTAPSLERSGPLGCRLVAKDADAGTLMIWRGAPDDADIEDPALWRACNPGPWITTAELARLARTLPETVFRRLVLNQWTESSGAVVRPDAYAACVEAGAAIADGAPVWAAVSIAPSRRDGALLLVSPRADGRRVVDAVVWEDEEDGQVGVLAEQAVRDIAARCRVESLAHDPWQFQTHALALEADGVPLYRGRTATQAGMAQTDAFMVPASQLAVDAIDQGVFAIGDDAALRRQVLRVESRASQRGAWRFARPKQVGERKAAVVEAAYALAMANYAFEQGAQVAVPSIEVWG